MSASPAVIAVPAVHRRVRPRVAIVVVVASMIGVLVAGYVGTNVWASIQQRHLAARFDAASARWAKLDPAGRSSVTFTTMSGDPMGLVSRGHPAEGKRKVKRRFEVAMLMHA